MTRILLTGGSGFMSAHILRTLLSRGHSVVTTVRTQSKADAIRASYPTVPPTLLSFALVPDVAAPEAFDQAVISEPPFQAVIHTASPYHFNATTAAEMIDPAVNGTVGILTAIQKFAPAVTRVVVTSSSAAVTDPKKPADYVYSEQDWNPVTREEVDAKNGVSVYRASKTFAERAAWEFVEREKPNFSLVTCCPPLVLGPVIHDLKSLDQVNTSNERIRDIYTGAAKDACPPTRNYLWVDVRDIAMAHTLAVEKLEVGGERFFITAGNFCNADIVRTVGEKFPELKGGLPSGEALRAGEYPETGTSGFDNGKSRTVLGLEYRGLEGCVVDTVRSLMAVEER